MLAIFCCISCCAYLIVTDDKLGDAFKNLLSLKFTWRCNLLNNSVKSRLSNLFISLAPNIAWDCMVVLRYVIFFTSFFVIIIMLPTVYPMCRVSPNGKAMAPFSFFLAIICGQFSWEAVNSNAHMQIQHQRPLKTFFSFILAEVNMTSNRCEKIVKMSQAISFLAVLFSRILARCWVSSLLPLTAR